MPTDLNRTLAMLAALLMFTFNEMHLRQVSPGLIDAAHGLIHPLTVRLFGGVEQVFVSGFDVALRSGLAASVVTLALWTILGTLRPSGAGKSQART